MTVIGIDPGSRHFGFGIIELSEMKLVNAGTLNLSHRKNIPERLKYIYQSLLEIIEKYSPKEMAVEKAFVGKKITSSFVLSYTRAIAFLVAAQREIPVYEYSSTEIKKALTGYGRAHKIQVKSMVRNFLKLNSSISYDCADALAVAICHINSKILRDKIPSGNI
ncbi:Crossover junction endodeoxyribonuclease RuvC [Thermodesulfovibrio sp. N1]|uniref:crossover junction endodeoxyribonuclease RuvC n=1 Tax=unclassified Thermodesulfovibrio TaxID=2645936 RepID=UPI000858A2A1|nr:MULTISPECIES: crossover junction endodeoxyribonuclease RuvC [unclassified Thermodesulfovibrio]MDI1471370.1 crossover junction endodeoxyribonuclease RuvC [Thermodesulfovibrio sp. 1176]ODA44323.1 Crossover junction endodeoxyribonuclease RuvC [Thermodesulfovibrio sp. N1]